VVAGCAAGRPLVLAVRDAYRTPWQRDWVDALLAHRPDAVLVALGMPEDAELGGGATLLAFGAAQVNALAAAERLSSPRAC
jgi:beta-N-acetylhexosaminidase